ncbi:hypothetical protein EDD85DRAFT_790770 [Armillaria nabsnona]|nr:hypothetical protein EDD85DRAFT_790770 [Armillaria nabsnona]
MEEFAEANEVPLGRNGDHGCLEGWMKNIALALQRLFKSVCIMDGREGWKWFVTPKTKTRQRRIGNTVGADIGDVGRVGISAGWHNQRHETRMVKDAVKGSLRAAPPPNAQCFSLEACLMAQTVGGCPAHPSIPHAEAALIDAYSAGETARHTLASFHADDGLTGANSPLKQADIGVVDANASQMNANDCLIDADIYLIDANASMVKSMSAPAHLMVSILGAKPSRENCGACLGKHFHGRGSLNNTKRARTQRK